MTVNTCIGIGNEIQSDAYVRVEGHKRKVSVRLTTAVVINFDFRFFLSVLSC